LVRIRISSREISRQKVDLAVCFAHEGETEPRGITDAGLKRELRAQMKADRFKAQAGDRLVWSSGDRFQARRFLVLGLGPDAGRPAEVLRLGCARAARSAVDLAARTVAIQLPEYGTVTPADAVRSGAEGTLMGAYRFERHLTDPARRSGKLTSVELATSKLSASAKKALRLGQVSAEAICFARDLVNEAPSRLTPRVMANLARSRAKTSKLRCSVLGQAELQKLGLKALLAVSRGSAEPPRVVHLAYRPPGKTARSKKKILLVGKGVTFDSGGLDLKPADAMIDMKMDMAGAGAVLATMTALADIDCRVEVHALLGLVENMTGASAYKPGDILDTWLGKTVEVGNTDAEGRLVLCDLLAYGAAKLKPTHVVDLATLTGACVVALGTRASGLFTRHDDLRDALMHASADGGEKLWPMPLYDEYLPLLQRGPADLRNIGGRWGGAITAGLFLGEFLSRKLPWAHLDIAGPAFTDTDLPEAPTGGTGAGVSTLLRWLENA
jgi:leucyl aminopeptidase